jgi:hypothetical protein
MVVKKGPNTLLFMSSRTVHILFISAMGRAIPAAPFFVIGGGEGQGTAGAGSADCSAADADVWGIPDEGRQGDA